MRLITFPPDHSLSTPLFFYCCFRSRGAALLSRSRSICGSSSHFGLFVGLTPQPGFFSCKPSDWVFIFALLPPRLSERRRAERAGGMGAAPFFSQPPGRQWGYIGRSLGGLEREGAASAVLFGAGLLAGWRACWTLSWAQFSLWLFGGRQPCHCHGQRRLAFSLRLPGQRRGGDDDGGGDADLWWLGWPAGCPGLVRTMRYVHRTFSGGRLSG